MSTKTQYYNPDIGVSLGLVNPPWKGQKKYAFLDLEEDETRIQVELKVAELRDLVEVANNLITILESDNMTDQEDLDNA